MNTTLITNSILDETTPERWILLAPYGDHPHANGIQRVDEESVHRMVRSFHSLWGTIKRALIGRPVYHGHPDVPENTHKDLTPYGLINALTQRAPTSTQPGGLYARITLTEDGAKLVQAGIRWLSPYWKAEEILPLPNSTPNLPQTQIYRPIELLSVGLTTHPNIRGEALANSQQPFPPPHPDHTHPTIKTIALTQNLRAQYPCAIQTLLGQEQIRSFINEKRRTGQTYDDAFNFFFIP